VVARRRNRGLGCPNDDRWETLAGRHRATPGDGGGQASGAVAERSNGAGAEGHFKRSLVEGREANFETFSPAKQNVCEARPPARQAGVLVEGGIVQAALISEVDRSGALKRASAQLSKSAGS
jgi:hypothetical protein